jgi:hypothetical protein
MEAEMAFSTNSKGYLKAFSLNEGCFDALFDKSMPILRLFKGFFGRLSTMMWFCVQKKGYIGFI